MAADQALDFSLKKSPIPVESASNPDLRNMDQLRMESSPHSSLQSSPRSSQSPSSTTNCGEKPPHHAAMFAPFMTHGGGHFSNFNALNFLKSPPSFAQNHAVLGYGLPGANASLLDPFSPTGMAPNGFGTSLMASGSPPSANVLGAIPDPTYFPTASLALSTLHRRRRSSARPTPSQKSTEESKSASAEEGDSPKKLKMAVEDEKVKDDAYWDRRKKNNEAAKRSRDARRAKEEEIALRATILEQENLKLRAQVAILKNETAKLHLMLFSSSQHRPSTLPLSQSFAHQP